MNGNLLEVFRSYQGEGPYAGVRQIFVRLAGCHLRCAYCDTPESWGRSKTWRVEDEIRPNPARSHEVGLIMDRWMAEERFHSVSFTGGEPLLQPVFLRRLALEARDRGLVTYLDTSGTLSDRLRSVIDLMDIVAMDVKLPSTPGVHAEEDDVRRCLEVAGEKAFVKIVCLGTSSLEEVDRAGGWIAAAGPRIQVVLQIVTPVNDRVSPPSGEWLVQAQRTLRAHGLDTSILPQLHVLAGWK